MIVLDVQFEGKSLRKLRRGLPAVFKEAWRDLGNAWIAERAQLRFTRGANQRFGFQRRKTVTYKIKADILKTTPPDRMFHGETRRAALFLSKVSPTSLGVNIQVAFPNKLRRRKAGTPKVEKELVTVSRDERKWIADTLNDSIERQLAIFNAGA